jgi:outer membrane protein assembly factor BamB
VAPAARRGVLWTTNPALAAYTLATGKQAWTKPFDPVDEGRPVIVDGLLIAQHEDGFLYAFDAKTGQELWRYNPLSEYLNNYGACLVEVLAVGDTIVAVSDEYLYGVDGATGKEKYRLDTRDGTRRKPLRGLVQAGGYVYGVTAGQFWAIDARTGRTAWTLPGEYSDTFVGTAAADGVVYFQGRVGGVDTGPNDGNGILHAVDVQTRQVRVVHLPDRGSVVLRHPGRPPSTVAHRDDAPGLL